MVTRLEKLTKFKIGVSNSWSSANGPSRVRSGSFAKAKLPSRNPVTLTPEQSKQPSQSINAWSTPGKIV